MDTALPNRGSLCPGFSGVGLSKPDLTHRRNKNMSCKLLGRIAVVADPAMEHGVGEPAVRVFHPRHDLIFVNPAVSLYDRISAIMELVHRDERDLLVYGVPCTCVRSVQPLSA